MASEVKGSIWNAASNSVPTIAQMEALIKSDTGSITAITTGRLRIGLGASACQLVTVVLDPEGSTTCPPGSFALRTNGTIYYKASGTSNTGWVALAVDSSAQAALSGYRGFGNSTIWTSEAGAAAPPDGTRDLVATIKNQAGTVVATRTLRGTFTSATGLIAVTAVSTTGEATTYALEDDGTSAVRAIVTHTASKAFAYLSWLYIDVNTAGITPDTGGTK